MNDTLSEVIALLQPRRVLEADQWRRPLVTWTDTPVGRVPTRIDYTDYRDVSGVRMPFKWIMTQTYMQMNVELGEVQPNMPIEAGRFARPARAFSA